MRTLAASLAQNGFAAFRFDYRGTGDSSGDFGSTLANPGWIEDVQSAVTYLRQSGIQQISAVGMRLGATLVGLAATDSQLALNSFVAWDPCESGRSFLRELRALETLRHESVNSQEDGSVETAEYLFSREMAESIRSLSLTHSGPMTGAARTLVVSREKRPLSTSLRNHLQNGAVEFETTVEQETLIDIHPFYAQTPANTISRIVKWLCDSQVERKDEPRWTFQSEAVLQSSVNGNDLVEKVAKVGTRRLFAVTSEPKTTSTGPWVVFLSGVHEDHTGPSRLWVEIPRRLATMGLRCVRIDLSGTGESPRGAGDPPVQGNDSVWIRDVYTIGPSISPRDPSDCVYIGYCSGGFLAVEGAFGSGARGVCTINLPAATDYSHAISRLENSGRSIANLIARVMRRIIGKYDVIGEFLWLSLSWMLPNRWTVDIMENVISRGTMILAMVGPADQAPYRNVPLLRRFGDRLARAARPYPFTLVPTLDHDMSFATGRADMTEQLERFLESHFVQTPSSYLHDIGKDDNLS